MNEEMEQDFDVSESVWKIDGPINRKSYIWISLGITIVGFFLILLKLTGLLMLLFPVAIIIAIILLWLTYASMTKRYYDITGSLKWGVIISIAVFLLTFVFKPVVTIAWILGLCIPGKLIK